jgi:hypothetical protein
VIKIVSVFILFVTGIAIIYTLWIGWAFTLKLRELLDHWAWSLLVYFLAVAALAGLGLVIRKIWPRLILGGPAFGKLGGMGMRFLATAIRARAQFNVTLFHKDKDLIELFNTIQNRMLHDALKSNYLKLLKKEGRFDEKSDEEWPQIWENEILDMTFDGQSIREACDPKRLGLGYANAAVARATGVVPIFGMLFWVPILFMIYLYANHQMALLSTIQIALALGFLLAAFWYIFVLHNLSVMPLTFEGTGLPEPAATEFRNDIETLEGTEVRPKKVEVKPKFYTIMRDYQFRLLLSNFSGDIIALLLVLGASLGVIFLIDKDFAATVIEWYTVMAYGVLLAPIGLAISFYTFTVLLQNFRKFIAAIIAAVLTAGLPFLFDYLLGGKVDMVGVREAIFAGSGALSVGLVTAITSRVKESLE